MYFFLVKLAEEKQLTVCKIYHLVCSGTLNLAKEKNLLDIAETKTSMRIPVVKHVLFYIWR